MPKLIERPPHAPIEVVTDILHGVRVEDPYRWLEDPGSLETRAWLESQGLYARDYLNAIPGRAAIGNRIRELLDIESHDRFLKCGSLYVFSKRLQAQEQPSICLRQGATGQDQLLIDPAARGTGDFTAVRPIRLSWDGSLLLYEVKQGGERAGTFEILDIRSRVVLSDGLPHGSLRGFVFAPDNRSFTYVHEPTDSNRPYLRAAFRHTLGTAQTEDKEVFFAGEDHRLRLALVASSKSIGFLVYHYLDKTYTDFYITDIGCSTRPIPILREADYCFQPRLIPGRILAMVDEGSLNRRLVQVQSRSSHSPLYFDLVPESDVPIQDWTITASYLLVSYVRNARVEILLFDRFGKRLGEIPTADGETSRILAACPADDQILIERESFTHPKEISHYALPAQVATPWAARFSCFRSEEYSYRDLKFPSSDGVLVPMFLAGRRELLDKSERPILMTAYGGFGLALTPQFSVLVAILMEHGVLFALPRIRGGSDLGEDWHRAAKRRHRQVAIDDFVAAARWLIESSRTTSDKLAIFGGSNSGLLVGAALTQHPELFQAVLCMVPILDMVRYHLFDNAFVWTEEFGVADDPQDFRALLGYSPYHAIRQGTQYPATMIVSGDRDANCNPLHARKMTARLQAANTSASPILLDYSQNRGHSPVLPLSTRIAALTDRLAFLFDQLGLTPGESWSC